MKSPFTLRSRRLGVVLSLSASILVVAAAGPAKAAGSVSSGISFATPVTVLPRALPLYKLTRIAPPSAFVAGALSAVHANSLAVENARLVSRDERRVARAYVDATTGEAQIFPDLSTAGGAAPKAGELAARAGQIFARADVIPHDATEYRLGQPTPIYAATVARTANGRTKPVSATELLFTYVPARRFASGLPVYGAASQATVGIASDGTVRAFVRRWQAARRVGSIAPTKSAQQVMGEIAAQLRPLEKDTAIVVDDVVPAYYDADATYLQPVYLFNATLHPLGKGSAEHVRGYVAVGRLAERIPVIGQSFRGMGPSAPRPGSAGQLSNSTSISLGQYANRDGQMEDMANSYLSGFDSVPAGFFGPAIARNQWYWAYSYQVQASANSYLNAMQVAYTQPHGDWWLNTTDGRGGDPWYVANIGVNGSPGYGAASGGRLATWIIDSCEVIPSYYDLSVTTGNGYNAFNTWWQVFQGLHRALGFRTEMLLGEDTMNFNIAQNMAFGVAADSAFYNGVAAVSFPTYPDQHLGYIPVHYDRVSIMEDPRNFGESIYSVQGQSASGQLHNSWMGN